MELRIINSRTKEELLKETSWNGEVPRTGDVMELHLGETQRWRVEEVDWVFAEAPPDQHEDVPVKHLAVLVRPADEPVRRSATAGPIEDRVCECGHKESIHSPNGCTGRAHTCE